MLPTFKVGGNKFLHVHQTHSFNSHFGGKGNAGREFIKFVKQVISTPGTVERLAQNNVTGLNEWESIDIATDKIPGLASYRGYLYAGRG
jgi:hypothetical protein